MGIVILVSKYLIVKNEFFLLNFLFIIITFVSVASAANFGAINVDGVGPIYVVGQNWVANYITVHEDGFTLTAGGRIYFASKPVDDFSDPFAYWETPLLGKHFTYE